MEVEQVRGWVVEVAHREAIPEDWVVGPRRILREKGTPMP